MDANELVEAMKRAGWRQVPRDISREEADGYNPLDVIHEGGLIVHSAPGDTEDDVWRRAIISCIDVASGV